MLKYIGYYAELPINLPKEVEERIVDGMLKTGVSQSESKKVKGLQYKSIPLCKLLY